MDQTSVEGIPNTELIRDNTLKVISCLVEFVDAIFPVYKQKKGGRRKHLIFFLMKTF